jgi:REP element-mobilizing transposase RayT
MKTRKNSLRLQNYDYSDLGAYFVTICTQDKEYLFGKVTDDIFLPNELGSLIRKHILNFPHQSHNIELDEFVIMPNHIHAIIWIVGAIHESPKNFPAQNITFENRVIRESPLQRRNMLLSKVIGKFKMQSAKEINSYRNTPGQRVWQRHYYDHIIRNQEDLNNTKKYIIDNPINWEKDENYLEK